MFACCNLCYEKYILADGMIDEAMLTAAREKWKAYAKSQNLSDDRIRRGLDQAPCRCDCHKVGTNIMH